MIQSKRYTEATNFKLIFIKFSFWNHHEEINISLNLPCNKTRFVLQRVYVFMCNYKLKLLLFKCCLQSELMTLEAFTAIDLTTLLSKKESLPFVLIVHLKILDRTLAKLIDKILTFQFRDSLLLCRYGMIFFKWNIYIFLSLQSLAK